MKQSISVSGTGIVYENPNPFLRSIVAYHPSLVILSEDEYLSTFDIGQATEALDYHTVVARSEDAGESWNLEGPLYADPPADTTHSIRSSSLRDGSLVGFGGLFDRQNSEAGLLNRETFGFVPVDLFWIESRDGGRSWTAPREITPPLPGPSWEICHAIVELSDSRWLAPTATWPGWSGEKPSGEQTVVFISDDRGLSWPSHGCCFDGRTTGLKHWEVSVVGLQDRRVLAVAWVYDPTRNTTLPTEYSISNDLGESFGRPLHTGFHSQTCKLIQLSDGRLFSAYRRHDKPGLWATLSHLEEDRWVNLAETPLWTGAESGMSGIGKGANQLSGLKFGSPSLRQLSSGEVFLLFWCQEGCLTHIRWIRVRID